MDCNSKPHPVASQYSVFFVDGYYEVVKVAIDGQYTTIDYSKSESAAYKKADALQRKENKAVSKAAK